MGESPAPRSVSNGNYLLKYLLERRAAGSGVPVRSTAGVDLAAAHDALILAHRVLRTGTDGALIRAGTKTSRLESTVDDGRHVRLRTTEQAGDMRTCNNVEH